MTWFSTLAAYGPFLALLPSLARAAPSTCPDGLCLRSTSPATLTAAQVQREIGPQLCDNSIIFGSDSPQWANATARYQAYMAPDFLVAVKPACESDIPTIIKYANSRGLPFYAVNRGHGLPVSQGKFRGLEIDMQALTAITISPDKKTALFQGGTYDQQVNKVLWEQGYVTTTGSCDCVGMLGPGLGGGHGRYQGFYGLISDNFVKLNVVLANGKAITVSNSSHADLFWGMKGAGHNFGVVTSFELKIYPRLVDSWYFKNYIFTQDKLEQIFVELNKLQGNGTQPIEMAVQYGLYYIDPTISATEAIIFWSFAYAGSQEDAQPYLTPFDNLSPVNITDGNVPYPEIADATGTGAEDPVCDKGLQRMVGTAGLQVYNLTTQRQLYDLLNEKIKKYPALIDSTVLMEGYSVAGVRNVSPDSSAFPLRDDYLLMQTVISYPPNSTLDPLAIEWAAQNRDLWNQGQPTRKPTTYVNYGAGTESLQSIYGYEPWRLERLRKLKAKYDPENKFSYYNPIIRRPS